MNDLESVARTVAILERRGVDYALLHCTSMYPTPYEKVRLGALAQLRARFPNAVTGLSRMPSSVASATTRVPSSM
jgi:N-acetylneuraminate synthase